jgi:hypothetical protein
MKNAKCKMQIEKRRMKVLPKVMPLERLRTLIARRDT